VDVHNGEMQLGNGSMVTAGEQSVTISLNRGGELRVCSTSSVHLSHDRSIDAPGSTALMLALDRGAVEASYTVGKYSDVLLTPDLRVLVSGPGQADLRIRVNGKGDTCVDNRGVNAPYVTVTSQLEGGIYRVQPGQHVMFEHGSLREVVDTETEPCGCPPPAPVSVAANSSSPAQPGQPVGGPSSTPEDTAFPLALSEGLTQPPPLPTTPVVPPGQVHAEVVVPLTYNGEPPKPAASAGNAAGSAASVGHSAAGNVAPENPGAAEPTAKPSPAVVSQGATAPAASVAPRATAAATRQAPAAGTPTPSAPRRFLRRVGHFFSKIFGAEE
jgi:hypothetical protein